MLLLISLLVRGQKAPDDLSFSRGGSIYVGTGGAVAQKAPASELLSVEAPFAPNGYRQNAGMGA